MCFKERFSAKTENYVGTFTKKELKHYNYYYNGLGKFLFDKTGLSKRVGR